MNEVEKMYENAGIEPDINYVCDKEPCEQHSVDCQKCLHLYDTREDYPDFTAEKQLSLMAFLINRKVELSFKTEQGGITVEAISRGLAGIVNRIWQDLTDAEKQQIKEILE